MSTKVSPFSVRFWRLVTLCQRLRWVSRFWRFMNIQYVCMHMQCCACRSEINLGVEPTGFTLVKYYRPSPNDINFVRVCRHVVIISHRFLIITWWRFGAVSSDVGQINEVTLRRARLVLGWVTVSGFNSRCGKFISV